ncbi:hypothetical protein QF037_008171 [Streptomyces canus]|uniref:hypothetical protein n=1 Tax=Streptomyces canus TaxID=58343 RepID=UPI00278AEE62|nr:hypothetical protein [Streptomyces canus]MDQ0603826.1 hypothetical protein [Streptomyces canus]
MNTHAQPRDPRSRLLTALVLIALAAMAVVMVITAIPSGGEIRLPEVTPPPHGRGHLTAAVLAGHHPGAALSLMRAGRHAPGSVRRGRPTSGPAP